VSSPGTTLRATDLVANLATAIGRGECILFLGAGVHSPPPIDSKYSYPENERPPSGKRLAETLAGECDFHRDFPEDSTTNLQRVALCYERRSNRAKLIQRVTVEITQGRKSSAALRALAALPFPIIVTTNYDQFFERALTRLEKEPQVSIYSADPTAVTKDVRRISPASPFVFKIHGDLSEPSSIVITDEDYVHFVMRMSDRAAFHPVPESINFYMKRWPTLFVGYSLMDYNLRLLFKSLRWKVDKAELPDTYSVDLYPDPLILDVYGNEQRYVQFIAQDVWKFVPDLYRRVTGQEMPT
jgi:hypothetical protein